MEEIKIGNQIWMKSNLDVDKFRNGDYIEQAISSEHWCELRNENKPAWCYPDFDNNSNEKLGKLYNWYAILDSRGLAPEGWHIPSDSEWDLLADTLGGQVIAADKLKNDEGWPGFEETDENNKPTGVFITDKGNNLSGFSALPTGYIFFHGDYFDFDYISFFATSDWYQDDNCSDLFPIFRYISSGWGELGKSVDDTCGSGSVRCVKDS